MLSVLATLAALPLVQQLRAESRSGYTQRSDGLWYNAGGVAHSLVEYQDFVAGTQYWTGCCYAYRPGYYVTRERFVAVPVRVIKSEEDELSQLVRMLVRRADSDTANKRLATRHALVRETAAFFGLERDFRFDAYEFGPRQPAAAALIPVGNTLYGVTSVNAVSSSYLSGDNIPLVAQLGNRQIDAADRSMTEVSRLVGLNDEAKATLTANLIQNQADLEMVREIRRTRQSFSAQKTTQVTPVVPNNPPVVPPPEFKRPTASVAGPQFSDRERKFRAFAGAKCAACHGSDPATNHGFDVFSWPHLDPQTKLRYYEERIGTRDPEKVMPRDAQGKGHSLTFEEKAFMLQS